MAPKFSLQPVLDYRHNLVDALEIELGQLVAAQQQNYDFLETLDGYHARLLRDLQQQQAGEMDLMTVNQLRTNLKLVEDRIKQQKRIIQELEKQVASKRSEVISAKQNEETLVTLKNKETERFAAEQARQEIRMQDDIYIAQAFRRTSNSH